MRTPFYLALGLLLWYCVYKAGLHPTLAGVLIGLLTPASVVEESTAIDIEDGSLTLVERLQHKFHPLSSLIVVPIFAFANAGVVLSSQGLSDALRSPIAWGIVIGLAVGKPIGILSTSLLVAKFGWAELPAGTSNRSLLATGSTAGIGFTVAIFIAKLAFTEGATQDLAVTAVIVGSLISGLVAALLFRRKN